MLSCLVMSFPSWLPVLSACLLESLLHFLLHFSGVWHLIQPLLQTVSNVYWFQWELVCDFEWKLSGFENPTQNYLGACMSLKRACMWLQQVVPTKSCSYQNVTENIVYMIGCWRPITLVCRLGAVPFNNSDYLILSSEHSFLFCFSPSSASSTSPFSSFSSFKVVALTILCLAFVPLCASWFLPSLAVNSCIDTSLHSPCTSSLCISSPHQSKKHVFRGLPLLLLPYSHLHSAPACCATSLTA